MTYVVVLLLSAAGVVVAVLFNRLVRDRNRVNAAWSDIDVQLQRRHDLVPRLVDAVRHYAAYEKSTLEAVTALRDAATRERNVAQLGDLEEELANRVSRLLAVAEDYPDLKASTNFAELQDELVATENYLQFARRFYNGAVRALNTRVESVPSNLVAAVFGFGCRDYFQKRSDDVANVPLVDLGRVE
ncbi:MAG: LemA family protein [Woeseiaceae bacterium]|nr:LemA family protein [Woeseiaceae bacterium]